MYDVIIIGMGPAGMSAGVYAKRANLNVLLIEKNAPGGAMLYAKEINNYLGFENISGIDLATDMFKHLESFKTPYKIDNIEYIEKKDDIFVLRSINSTYQSKSIIISTGRASKRNYIENEEALIGKGVSYCAVCDGALYKDKVVCVYGNDKEAINDCKYLASMCKKVYFLTKEDNLNIGSNVELINNCLPKKLIEKDGKVYKIMLDNNKELEIDCFFNLSNSNAKGKIFDKLPIYDENGSINVNKNFETTSKGIFAAGDAIEKDLYQVITAVSDGAEALINVKKYLGGNK